MESGNRHSDDFGMIAACVVLIVGVVLFMDQAEIGYLREMFRYWPAALIALGVSQLMDSQRV